MPQLKEEEYEVVVVGAGIAGLATAVALHRANVKGVVLLDKYDSVGSEGAAVMLFPNGWHAVCALGISEILEGVYPTCHREKRTNLETGETEEIVLTGTAETPGIGVRTVHRKTLLKILAEELPQDTIRFKSRLIKIERDANSSQSPSDFTRLRLEDGTIIKTKVLIGCDGVQSVVAQWLGLSQPADSGRSVVRGLAMFDNPHGFANEVQVYIFADKRGALVPLNDKEVYWYITHDTSPEELERTMHTTRILRKVTLNLADKFPDSFLDVVRHSDLNTVTWTHMLYRPPWSLLFGAAHRGHVTVAGDAFHPLAPNLSLGSCTTLEDAVVLARHVSNGVKNEDVKDEIEAYVKERWWRIVGLATGSYLSSWVQFGGPDSGILRRVVKSLGGRLFDRFVRPRIMDAMNYDCGSLNN
ncbi:hypothetical protein LUZ60_007491 [Juncus effusus]|nr:hypothetical protein LUZ60_007491 [Juncus effusus]